MNVTKTIYSCKNMEYSVVYTPDVVFAHRDCGDLTMQIVSPIAPDMPHKEETFFNPIREKFARWHRENPDERPTFVHKPETRRFPLIVDCPGSGWSGADGHGHVPFMVYLARQGFVAASISYRGTYRNNVVFPAAVQDLKEAIRFLRANADMFHIDPERVGLLGDSSGGNTVSLAALTDDADERFNIGEHLDQSAAVKACCNVYAPVDLINLVQDRIDEHKRLRPEEAPFPEGMPFEAMEIWQETYKADPEGACGPPAPTITSRRTRNCHLSCLCRATRTRSSPWRRGCASASACASAAAGRSSSRSQAASTARACGRRKCWPVSQLSSRHISDNRHGTVRCRGCIGRFFRAGNRDFY